LIKATELVLRKCEKEGLEAKRSANRTSPSWKLFLLYQQLTIKKRATLSEEH
jgi:hypothetical protein